MSTVRSNSWPRASLAAVALAACAPPMPVLPAVALKAPVATSPPAQPAAAAPTPALAPEPTLGERLNLSFEADDDSWRGGGPHYKLGMAADTAHAGKRALRIAGDPGNDGYGVVQHDLPLDLTSGKIVHLAGWIRTKNVVGWGGLWITAFGENHMSRAFADTSNYGATGTSDWTRYEVDLDVPAGVSKVAVGVILRGAGDLWADDLSISIEDCAADAPATIDGLVLAADGKPAPGVLVAAVKVQGAPEQVVRSDAQGHFHLSVPRGAYALTATGDGGVAVYWPMRRLVGSRQLELRLADDGFTLSGQVHLATPLPDGTRVSAIRTSAVEGDNFIIDVAPDGRFHARLPAAKRYRLSLEGNGLLAERAEVDLRQDAKAVLEASVPTGPGDDVLAWVQRAAVPIGPSPSGDHARAGKALAPLVKLIGDARVVALGQTVHGAHELELLTQEVVEYLVAERGFTVFALTVGATEVRRLDAYVQRGEGRGDEALTGLREWGLDTEEMRALVEWMRAYDADPRHKQKLHLVGVDIASTHAAWPEVKAYLRRVDPDYAAGLPAALEVFASARSKIDWLTLTDEAHGTCVDALDALVQRLDAHKDAYVRASSLEEWRAARSDARAVAQAAAYFEELREGFADSRYASMAENLAWELEQAGKNTRAILLGHGIEVERQPSTTLSLTGVYLAKRFGARYVSIALIFGEGDFYAFDPVTSQHKPVALHLDAAQSTDASAAFTRVDSETCLVDLRRAPRGPVADWLAGLRPMRELTGILHANEVAGYAGRLSRRFDAVLYVRKTTATRPRVVDAPAE